MTLIRANIEICSRLRTPLRGDTLWGHVACGVANHEGEDGIQAFCNMPHPFVISSAFPHGMLPKPLLPAEENTEEFKSKQDYTEFKKKKKQKYCSASEFLDVNPIVGCESGFVSESSTHVSISRETGTALDEMLFSVDEMWPDSKNGTVLMDIYISSHDSLERVEELLSWAFEFGFGADSTTGAGKVKLLKVDYIAPKKAKYGRYLALGPFISDADVLDDLRASTFLRKGKIGGVLAHELSPYKKSIIMYEEGATFRKTKEMEYVGRLLHNMHYTADYDICHSAFAPVIEV